MWCRISTKTWALQGNYTGFLGQFETVMVTHPIFSDSSGDGERLFAGVDCTSARNEMTKSFMRHYIRCTRMYFRDSLGVGKSGGPWGYYHGGWLAECTWCSPKLFARRPRCCQRLLGESREQEIPEVFVKLLRIPQRRHCTGIHINPWYTEILWNSCGLVDPSLYFVCGQGPKMWVKITAQNALWNAFVVFWRPVERRLARKRFGGLNGTFKVSSWTFSPLVNENRSKTWTMTWNPVPGMPHSVLVALEQPFWMKAQALLCDGSTGWSLKDSTSWPHGICFLGKKQSSPNTKQDGCWNRHANGRIREKCVHS